MNGPPPQLSPEVLAALQRDTLGPTIIAVVSAFTVLGFIFVALRFYARLTVLHNVGAEDYCILISFVHAVGMAACQIKGTQYGSGKHMVLLTLPELQTGLKWLYFSMLTYANALTFTKFSILLQYRRIFTVSAMRIPIYIVFAICVGAGVSAFFVIMFSCVPISAFWNIMEKANAKCIDSNAFSFGGAAVNIITDVMVAALPIRAIWQLQIPRRQRVALLGILCLGWFVCVISMIRLEGFVELTKHPDDQTYYGAVPAYWSAIEVNLGIVCACAPALKPLVVKVIPRFASFYGTGRSTRYGTGKSASRVTKDSTKDRKSFIELKGKSSTTTISDDLERGQTRVTALPIMQPEEDPHTIRVQTHLEQRYDDAHRDIDTDSEKDLVTRPQKAMSRL